MILTSAELELMKSYSLKVSNAREITDRIAADRSIGGIFPKGNSGDFSTPDHEKFRHIWFSNWEISLIMLRIAKSFADDITVKAIAALIELGEG